MSWGLLQDWNNVHKLICILHMFNLGQVIIITVILSPANLAEYCIFIFMQSTLDLFTRFPCFSEYSWNKNSARVQHKSRFGPPLHLKKILTNIWMNEKQTNTLCKVENINSFIGD